MKLRLFGVDIEFQFAFFLVLAIFLVADRTGLGVLMLLCVVMHELSHLLAMLVFRVRLRSVTFSPFGINIGKAGVTGQSSMQEAVIYFAGPFSNLVAAFVMHRLGIHRYFNEAFVVINLVMAVFNLLPISCLDGGNLLRALLHDHVQLHTLDKISEVVSIVALIPLFAAAFFLIFNGSGNFTLFVTCIYLAVLVVYKK